MEFPINGRAYPKQTPALYLFVERLEMRSFHGRSMLCMLIERALSLTEEDRQRYGLLMMGALKAVPVGAKPRRFTFVLTERDHPEAARKLAQIGADNIPPSRFIHLLEVAAGLMYAEAQTQSQPAIPVSSPASSSDSPPMPGGDSTPTPPPKSQPLALSQPVAAPAGTQLSARSYGDVEVLPVDALGGMFSKTAEAPVG